MLTCIITEYRLFILKIIVIISFLKNQQKYNKTPDSCFNLLHSTNFGSLFIIVSSVFQDGSIPVILLSSSCKYLNVTFLSKICGQEKKLERNGDKG